MRYLGRFCGVNAAAVRDSFWISMYDRNAHHRSDLERIEASDGDLFMLMVVKHTVDSM